MPLHQIEAFAIVGAMLALFVWDRLRYDVVACLALLAALLTGALPPDKAFLGFSNPVIIIIASVLVLSRAIAASGMLEGAVRRLLRHVRSVSLQIAVLTGCVAFLSAVVKNIGTLGIFLPIAIQTARRSGRSSSIYLMPLAFGSLIGGTITLIGTSPNLLISTVRQTLGQGPFGLFDFAAVGLPLTCIAVVFLSIGWRLVPKDRAGRPPADQQFEIERYTTELRVAQASSLIGRTVADLETMAEGDLAVIAMIRERGRRYIPASDWLIYEDDVLVVQADPTVVEKVAERAGLAVVGAEELHVPDQNTGDMDIVEAVVTVDSALVGQTPRSRDLRRRFQVNVLSVSRAGRRFRTRLRSVRFEIGDVVVLQGWQKHLPATLAELGLLPLADRALGLGRKRRGLLPLIIPGAALALVALRLLPVEVAFFGSAVLVVVLNQLTLKEAYQAIDGPILVMLGALIPVGEALKDTGATEVMARLIGGVAAQVPAPVALAVVLVAAMLVTPLLHHAAAVLVMGPVAATVAAELGLRTDPFLMAVALGASCDFLTPIGHQNNLLVMGPGGYRFGDYWRLGLPLSVIVVLVGTPLILLAWPLR